MPTQTANLGSRVGQQPLNAVDLALRCVDRAIRGMGYPGFETQTLVWLSGRIDTKALRRGLRRLARRHPAVTATLAEFHFPDRHAYWRLGSDAEITLVEIELDSADPSCVFACAQQLQSASHDVTEAPPLHFYLLHRRGGRDVLVMKYSHVLMDRSAAGILLRELERLTWEPGHARDNPCAAANPLAGYLRRFSHEERRSAAQRAIDVQGHGMRGRAAILGTGQEDQPRQVQLQIAARSISATLTRAIHDRAAALCGIPSPSMAILASTFRAIRQCGGDRNSARNYIAGIGLDLGLRGGRPLLQNLLSIVPIAARPEELDDQDLLVAILSRQMRDRLKSRIDLGVLRLITGFQRRPRHIEWVVEHFLRFGYSLWYAYFGSDDYLQRLANVDVERICHVGPTWSPMGISLLVNQFRGELFFQATFDPELVSEPLANEFLTRVTSNLTIFAAS